MDVAHERSGADGRVVLGLPLYVVAGRHHNFGSERFLNLLRHRPEFGVQRVESFVKDPGAERIGTLLVGLIVSIFQVTTQLQEITLSYVPKILTAAFLLIALGPWMLGRVTHFATSTYLLIPTLAG